ncbi:MAG: FixH family protein, partial [Thermomicrobiales bacterium]
APDASTPAVAGDHDAAMSHQRATPHPRPATPEPLPGAGTPLAGEGFTVEIAASPASAGPATVTVTLRADDGAPLTAARVVVLSDMPEMAMGRTETRATETQPGEYTAELVPLVMPGEWRLAIRVSPRGEPTQVFTFAVDVP